MKPPKPGPNYHWERGHVRMVHDKWVVHRGRWVLDAHASRVGSMRKPDHDVKTQALAYSILAQRWGDDIPRCRIDLTPAVRGANSLCRGKLTIDFFGEKGTLEHQRHRERTPGHGVERDVVHGRADLTYLRLLCFEHQDELEDEDPLDEWQGEGSGLDGWHPSKQ